MYANFKPSPVPISPSWTAYSYNSEFISLSAFNAISVMGMRQKEWKMIPSQPAASGPAPVQGFGHSVKCWLGDWTGVQWAPGAFCVTQHRAESLRAGIHTWKAPWAKNCSAAPHSSSWGHLSQGKLLCPHSPCSTALSSPSHTSPFPTAQTASISISPRPQCNLSPCFPAVMWNDKFHEELDHTST